MAKIYGNDLRPGAAIAPGGGLWVAVKTAPVKPGEGGAVAPVELGNLRDGRRLDARFRSADKVADVQRATKAQPFRDQSGETPPSADGETFAQSERPADILGDRRPFRQDGMTATVRHVGEAASARLPGKVVCAIVETEPVAKGRTAANGSEPAALDDRLRATAPPCVGAGETIVASADAFDGVERA